MERMIMPTTTTMASFGGKNHSTHQLTEADKPAIFYPANGEKLEPWTILEVATL
jgi:hypothetical protein